MPRAQNKPSWLAAGLGERHPYTRAVRLALAATLEARGASVEAASLRKQSAQATRGLLQGDARAADVLDEVPAPAGVLAHIGSNRAEQEGFRRLPDGGFFVPLTSTQGWLAGRDGWRLHVVAAGTCRASIVAGREPRLVAVSAARLADSTWQVRIEGTTPAITLHHAAADTVGVSLVANGTGWLQARMGEDRAHQSRIDTTTPPPDPPYVLAFDGERGGRGCAVVWLEVPFPYQTNVSLSPRPQSP